MNYIEMLNEILKITEEMLSCSENNEWVKVLDLTLKRNELISNCSGLVKNSNQNDLNKISELYKNILNNNEKIIQKGENTKKVIFNSISKIRDIDKYNTGDL